MSDELPRLLFVGAFPPAERAIFGGMVTSCRALLQSSLPKRATLDLLDSTQISNPPPPLMVRGVLALRRLASFVFRFERQRPDAVLLFAAVGASVAEKGAMAWYARLRGVPALMFPRGGAVIDECRRSRFTRWWVRRAFAGARMVLCQGPAWQRFAQEVLGFAVPDAPIVGNWTATSELLALGAARAARPRAASRPPQLLFVGWLDREKGVAELLDACERLAPARRFELTLLGEGNLSELARERVRVMNLSGRVHFRGWLRDAALLGEYAAADVFVLPSWAEGLPNAMIEAMAAGQAIVVSAVGNVPDVVTQDRSALLVAPRDVDSLAAALARVIDDAGLRAALGAAGHAIAAERFGVERAVDEILAAAARARREPRARVS